MKAIAPQDAPFEIARSLEQFTPHALSDLNNAKLMNRVDTKYLVHIQHLPILLKSLTEAYTCLQIDGKLTSHYLNTYYDTAQLDFYHHHHQGRLNRFKVRHRLYADSQLGFLEVKHKNAQSRTVKTRIESRSSDLHSKDIQTFIGSHGLSAPQLDKTQLGQYDRIALANEKRGERITIDMNLAFSTVDSRTNITLPRVAIIEVKQQKIDRSSLLFKQVKSLGYRPLSFSKYCIGQSLLDPCLKANRFKPSIRYLHKLQTEIAQ